MSTVIQRRLPSWVAVVSMENIIYTWSWSCFFLNAFMALHLPALNFICHYLGWSFSLLRAPWGLHHLPSYSLPIILYLYFKSFWSPCSLHLAFLCSGFPLLLTSLSFPRFHLSKDSQSFRFLHLDPSSFTFTVCSLYHPEKPYSFFLYFLLCHMVEIMSELYQTSSVWREIVPAARERERTECSCQANEEILRNFQY